VVDRPALSAGEVGNRETIIGEARQPEPAAESGQVLHQIDFIDPARVTHLLDRPEEDAFRARLPRLGAEEDANRRLLRWSRVRPDAEHDALRGLAHSGPIAITATGERGGDAMGHEAHGRPLRQRRACRAPAARYGARGPAPNPPSRR